MNVIHKIRTRHIAKLLCGLACWLPNSAALAQDSSPVQVTFEFTNVSVPLAEAKRKTLEAQIASELAKTLQAQVGFWMFQETAAASAPQVRVQLRKNGAVIMSMELVSATGKVLKKWEVEMIKAIDLEFQPLPKPDKWPSEISKTFSAGLVVPNQQDVLGTLKPSVPLGREQAIIAAVQNSEGLPSAVLPLKWETHRDISECQFLLRFDRPGGGKVTIHSTGLGNFAQYTPDHPQFSGVVVQLEKWQQGGIEESVSAHVGELPQLKPVEFYLKNEKLPGAAPQ
jgi:hypothetical protein